MASAITAAKVLEQYRQTRESWTDLPAKMAQRIADLENELNRVRGRKVMTDLKLLDIAQSIVDVTKQA